MYRVFASTAAAVLALATSAGAAETPMTYISPSIVLLGEPQSATARHAPTSEEARPGSALGNGETHEADATVSPLPAKEHEPTAASDEEEGERGPVVIPASVTGAALRVGN
jgi:hypothetical protein